MVWADRAELHYVGLQKIETGESVFPWPVEIVEVRTFVRDGKRVKQKSREWRWSLN